MRGAGDTAVDLAGAVRDRVPLERLAASYVTKLVKKGREWVGICPFHSEKTPSFTIVPAKRFGHCFGCGWHGDVIAFYMKARGVPFTEALADLSRNAGLDDPVAAERAKRRAAANERKLREDEARRRRKRISDAGVRWGSTVTPAGGLADVYMGTRGLDLARLGGWPADLRFDFRCRHHWDGARRDWATAPAIVASVRDVAGVVVAVHATYLQADGRKAERKVWGPDKGGAIRLQAADRRVAIAEGWETALSVAQALADRDPDLRWPVWAGISIGNIAGDGAGRGDRRRLDDPYRKADKRGTWFLPSREPDMARPGLVLPPRIVEVLLLEDNDNKDPPAAAALYHRAVRRWTAEGRRVWRVRPPQGMDFNDWLLDLARGKAA